MASGRASSPKSTLGSGDGTQAEAEGGVRGGGHAGSGVLVVLGGRRSRRLARDMASQTADQRHHSSLIQIKKRHLKKGPILLDYSYTYILLFSALKYAGESRIFLMRRPHRYPRLRLHYESLETHSNANWVFNM